MRGTCCIRVRTFVIQSEAKGGCYPFKGGMRSTR